MFFSIVQKISLEEHEDVGWSISTESVEIRYGKNVKLHAQTLDAESYVEQMLFGDWSIWKEIFMCKRVFPALWFISNIE